MHNSERTPLLWNAESPSGRNNFNPRGRSSPKNNTLPCFRQDTFRSPEPPPLPHALRHKDNSGNDPHAQFCALTGCPPSNNPPDKKFQIPKKSLYGRTVSQLSSQRRAYNATASLNNILLLSQVILGAALTALGASASSHILITIFGATNTIIAGLVAYLKSRGQPMRSRVYRDDLERIVDEIENSEVMWRGISDGVHGYDEIDTDEVTVRSEVARLTRLYDRAIRLNGMNNPDMYMAGAGTFDGNSAGGGRPSGGGVGIVPNVTLPAVAPAAPQPSGENPGPAVPVALPAEDAAPATKADVDGKDDSSGAPNKKEDKHPNTDGTSSEKGKEDNEPSSSKAADVKPADPGPVSSPVPTPPSAPAPTSAPALPPTPAPVEDPDASPATSAHLKPKKKDKQKAGNAEAVTKVQGDEEDD
ncbi:hypothetical protein H2198_007989 [Neophaeococcomyces mojaviensis]|uniref:Uncharacterized protein n=1 Tax=Neophaeococcomyces mojaviensis TaxID=3383035 RepID=A0ACC2ZYK1_9EURO|nr:hypothetical protein H2198_007989 [Knufia sp. JES_112]